MGKLRWQRLVLSGLLVSDGPAPATAASPMLQLAPLPDKGAEGCCANEAHVHAVDKDELEAVGPGLYHLVLLKVLPS